MQRSQLALTQSSPQQMDCIVNGVPRMQHWWGSVTLVTTDRDWHRDRKSANDRLFIVLNSVCGLVLRKWGPSFVECASHLAHLVTRLNPLPVSEELPKLREYRCVIVRRTVVKSSSRCRYQEGTGRLRELVPCAASASSNQPFVLPLPGIHHRKETVWAPESFETWTPSPKSDSPLICWNIHVLLLYKGQLVCLDGIRVQWW